MKNVLVFLGNEEAVAIDEAIIRAKKGDKVTIVQCDNTLGVCIWNPVCSNIYCKYCKHVNGIFLRKVAEKYSAISILSVSDLTTSKDYETARSFSFDYDSVEELKGITYKGVEIGFGALSTYVTLTRNVMPPMTSDFKSFINLLITQEVVQIEAIFRLHEKENYDFIIFHNGRFARYKPYLGLALRNRIEYMALEQVFFGDTLIKNNFLNNVPHDVHAIANKVLKNWDDGKESVEEKMEIGRSFFEKKRNGMAAGDKVYTVGQKKGTLPEDYDSSKYNIGIFNSSEDEYQSVSSDYDKSLLFPNQYIALKTIFERYKNDKTKHFYLRIHPNLKDVPFKSHMSLYELNYENVTIIPPNSSLDSYTLLDNCDKILTFDSTVGIEASYWGKPSVGMSWYIWSALDIVSHPNTQGELWKMLEAEYSVIKNNINLLKYGYSCLRNNQETLENVVLKKININLFGVNICDFEFLSLLNSCKIQLVIRKIMGKIAVRTGRFKRLPGMKPYKSLAL